MSKELMHGMVQPQIHTRGNGTETGRGVISSLQYGVWKLQGLKEA